MNYIPRPIGHFLWSVHRRTICKLITVVLCYKNVFVDCHSDEVLPLVQHGTRDNFTEVGAEVSSLVISELGDMGVCGSNLSVAAVQRIPLDYTRQVAVFIFAVIEK